MPEIVLHYIWLKGLFMHYPQITTDGREIKVLSTGHHNLDAGPDFSDVHLVIGGIELVGEVEIHVDSRDWYYHHHDLDPAYNRLILHVVSQASQPVYNAIGQVVPQLELQYNKDQDYIDRMLADALSMDSGFSVHRCAERLKANPNLISKEWKSAILHQRLSSRCESIERLLQVTHNDWRQAFYICLAHALGFHINGVPMELLALSTPLSVLAKHRNQVSQLSALLLGQSGLLEQEDPLYQEYTFLRHKYQLQPIDSTLWKQGRLRPHNRPRVRILQMAQLVHHGEGLLSRCLDTTDVKSLQQLFAPSQMGKDSVNSLLINVVAPFMYARGQHGAAIRLLQQVPAENNRVVRQWQLIGQSVSSAADTQALLHLHQIYCESGRCLNCGIWSEIQ